ncbi:MAG: hypothetical protein EBU08_20225 [Micrococcales bacterium]|nr:hypothetical protein [Micrococcales bacterium]
MPVRENVSLASLRQDQRHGFRDAAREEALSAEMIQSLRIKTPSDRQENPGKHSAALDRSELRRTSSIIGLVSAPSVSV